MSAVNEIDIGPLTWVKGEIDLALGRAADALQQFVAEGLQGSQLKFAQTHLHQAHGAIAIVGLDGLTQVSEVLEQLLSSLEQGRVAMDPEAVDVARGGLDEVRRYLDDLIRGVPNQPLRLFPLYERVQRARGQNVAGPSELFFPDLTQRPPKRGDEGQALSGAALAQAMKTARARFERGFLQMLRSPDGSAGLPDMRAAVAAVEQLQTLPSARAFWWATLALLDILNERQIPVDLGVKRLCARVDTQMRRFAEGARTVAERLMRDVLYHVAVAPAAGAHVCEVKRVYRLDALIPGSALRANIEPLRPVLREIRESVAEAKEDWNRFCAGVAVALPQFDENVKTLASATARLAHDELSALGSALAQVAQWLRRNPLAHGDADAMEVATALLLIEQGADRFEHLDAEFGRQAAVLAERLGMVLRGESPPPLDLPMLDEMSRHAQDELYMGHVVREIQASLAQIEQVLDGFFRDNAKRAELATIEPILKQVQGALTVLGQPDAAVLLADCAAQVHRFGTADYSASQEEFESVAHKLSGLGFFVQALQHGPADLGAILDPRTATVVGRERTVEQELEQQRREAQELMAQLKDRPQDQALRNELKHNLENIRQEAALIADTQLERQAKEALTALAASDVPAPAVETKLAEIAAPAPAAIAPGPSAETAKLAAAAAEELDSELLAIFIEEAHEVLATIASHLDLARAEPSNQATLTTIRRAFHTLKGSGRMVGLKDFGEAAWSIEQVMNRWLQLERDADADLLDLIARAHGLFAAWTVQLEAGGGPWMDASVLIARAEALREGRSPAADLGVPPAVQASLSPELPPLVAGELLAPEAPAEGVLEVDDLEDEDTVLAAADLTAFEPAFEPEPASPPQDEEVSVGTQTVGRSLFEMYTAEAGLHVATLRRELARSHVNPTLLPTHDTIRAAHTLAGISATVGFDAIHDLARALEQALSRVAQAQLAPPPEQSEILNAAAGSLEAMVAGVAELRPPQQAQETIEALHAIAPIPPEISLVPSDAPAAVVDEYAASAPAVDEQSTFPVEPPQPVPALVLVHSAPSAAPVAPASAPVETEERRKLRLTDDIDEQLLPLFLEEAQDILAALGVESRNWHEAPASGEASHAVKRLLHTLKGSARMAGAMGLGELVHAVEARVEQAIAQEAVTPAFFEEFDGSVDRAAFLVDQLRNRSAAAPAPADGTSAGEQGPGALAPPILPAEEIEASSAQAMLRVRAELVDRFVNEAGEMSIARSRIEGEMRTLRGSLLDLTENVIRLRNQLRELEIQAESQMQSRMAQAEALRADFDPLEFDRFTRLQELTRMIAEGVNDVTTVQHNVLKNLDGADAALAAQARLNRDLQQALMSVRMVPFASLGDRLHRIVRQTAKELDLKASLDIRGGQVEIDRSVLDKITGPLEHLLRNSVSHGIESPAERAAHGKREIGEVSLAVSHEGNEVAIELADDGKGLDFERIRAKAIEAGLLAPEADPDEAVLTDLIFRPGFSTAGEVSQVSGRGVGMDVVKSTVGSLGGRLEVTSVAGQGARFRVYLPLSLTVTQALLVRSGGRTFAIPSAMVEQVMELRAEPLAKLRAEGAAEWLGNRYAFHYLPRLLGDNETEPQPARYTWVILLRSASQRIAIQIDELRGNQEVVVKGIGPQLARVVGIAGATVLGDGEIVLIINPVALASRGARQDARIRAVAPAAGLPAEQRRATVMVVDDSLTVRKITGRLLEREGFRVLTAKDGVDALEQLLEEVPDVMLVDIEMPRMDGFDLTRNIRADARLESVPVIMITSRIAEKHRSYAKEIGVDHYLGKPYQEEELLGLIRSYVEQRAFAA
jgi:chemosensory pili system protein ChpA (sensor histidine kinase/response regulator)